MKNDILNIVNNALFLKFLIAVFCFYCIDFVTGITKAIRIKEKISSAKLKNSVIKALRYCSFIAIGVVVDFLFSIDKGALSCCIVLCSIELKSITENLDDLKIPAFILNLFKGSEEND